MLPSGELKNCIYCNSSTYIPKYRINTFKYCSRKCAALNQRHAIKASCLICNKEFNHISARCKTAKYCSNKCRYQASRKRGKSEYKCPNCNIQFFDYPSRNRIFCSKKCKADATLKNFKPTLNTVRKSMRRRNLINECNRCGFNSHPLILGVHHKDRNQNNNNISNLEILCPNCHSIEHSQHTVIRSIPI